MKYTLCITTYNRTDLLFESFAKVANDPRLHEILIVDDCSNADVVQALISGLSKYSNVRLIINPQNKGMAENKKYAVSQCLTDWVILFDSDNIMDSDYLDALGGLELQDNCIYMPDAAKPNFDFTKFGGVYMGKEEVKKNISDPMFNVCCNTCNYLINKDFYLNVAKPSNKAKGADTINHLLGHLKAGGQVYVVPNMAYIHRDHAGSEYRKDLDYNMIQSERLRKEIKQL